MEDVVLQQIAERATSLTMQNKITWASPNNRIDYFKSKIGDQELVIFNSAIRYVFEVYDSNKNLLGSIDEDGFSVLWPTTSALTSYQPALTSVGLPNPNKNYGLKTLFDIAKKSVVDVDKRLYELLDRMKSM